ncbi:uncharacterized protein LOC128238461 isoform X2 [Mya arenaria]|uniref:uncharacterized protein LOC128238461 isoform X2 n=1 Tax=Mya arenaria TaxID=6604 RepID=UPI0022E25CAE|nr:uncharacterized protein LOC128238461 isoform X2 [Mya arenaria]
MGETNIVEDWLKSINLDKYAQQFLDNGYDDLEICKQIGADDLEAINVDDADQGAILTAVKELKEKGGTSVYLTLEQDQTPQRESRARNGQVPVRPTLDNLLADVPPPSPANGLSQDDPRSIEGERSKEGKEYEGGLVQENLVIYPKSQLTLILRDKVFDDRIDLAGPPYTAQNLAPCWSSLTALAIKYARDLCTHVEAVLDRLEDVRWWLVSQDTASVYSPASMTSSGVEDPYYMSSLYAGSPRGGPPPIPSVPPPEVSHMDGYGQLHSIQTRYSDAQGHANYVTLDTGMCCVFPKKKVKGETDAGAEKKKTSTLGRLFRNMGFRRSSRKHSYKKHDGDLLAHEITMGDNDRIALMQMVKEGRISTDTALQVVRKFEEERRRDIDQQQELAAVKDKKGKKKSHSLKPTKSPSINYSDGICEGCGLGPAEGYPGVGFSGQCRACQEGGCRHRRVHSVSHIAYPAQLHSPGAGRALSCSPMRSHSQPGQNSTLNSPVGYAAGKMGTNIYTPVIPHELKMYTGSRGMYGVHGIDMIKDRLSVIKTSSCVHKTQSKASLISSESDHSMECSAHLASQLEAQAEETYFPSNVSNVSMGSEILPNGRRQAGSSTMEKMRNHKWARTGSAGLGEDGMSMDTDDLDDPDRQLLGGGSSSSNMMEKFRGVKNEMRKRILHTRDIIGDGKSQHLCSAYQSVPGASSGESCSSGVGSQTSQGPWVDLEAPAPGLGPVLGLARVHSNYTPTQEEKDFLHMKRGERVHVMEASSSGIWKGRIDNRVGYFHFNFVDMVTENTPLSNRKDKSRRRINRRSKPRSVEELLQRIGLEHLAPIFLMNGFDNLEIFAEIDHDDLNALNILDSESRTKLITAADLLSDYDDQPQDQSGRVSRSATATPTSQQYAVPWTSFLPATKPSGGSRDSGCYDSSECMSRDNDPYAGIHARNRVSGVDNKENLRPVRRVVLPVQYGGMNQESFPSGAKFVSGVKEEKIYSEEDREVCDLTGYRGNKLVRSSPQSASLVNGHESASSNSSSSDVHSHYRCLNIPILGPDWKVFSDCCSQTSPYGPLDETCDQTSHPYVVDSLPVANSVQNSLLTQQSLRKKFKPYAKKISPSAPMKDAQVQVMCPLGVQLQSPASPPNVSSVMNQSITSVADYKSQTGTQAILTQSKIQHQSTENVPKDKSDNSVQSRVSYISQSSREGDSGSDASTVKSEKLGSELDLGRCTPDSMLGSANKNFKSIKRSVIPKVTSKLAAENIDLSAEPYSSPVGACGIPPLLVQRYAEELKHDLFKTALILDQVRIHKLTSLGRPSIPSEQLTENSLASSELKISSIPDFFISIGLPMYAGPILSMGHQTVDTLAGLTIKEIQAITKADRKHLKRIIHALEWVQTRLKSPGRKQKPSPVKDKV